MGYTKRPFSPNKASLLTILLSSMVILMGAAAVAPALRPISEAFPDMSEYMISLVITLPAVSVALTGFGMGYLADRFGKAKVFFISLMIFTAAGVSGYLTDSFELMLVGRFILGIGITGISLTTTALIGEYWTGMSRAKIIGYQSAAIGVGTLFLETMGGALADIGWQEPFLIYLIGIPIIILGLFSIREVKRSPESAMEASPELVIPSKGRKIALCYIVVFLEMFLMFSLPTNFSFYVTEMEWNLTMCGVLLGLMGVAQAIFSILYGRRSNKLGEHDSYAVSFLMMGVGLMLLFIPNIAATFASMVVVGFSLGLLMPTVIGQLSLYSTAKTSGKVMGGYSVALNISTFVSAMAVTPVITMLGSYTSTFLVLGIVSLMICAVFVVTRVLSKPTVVERPVLESETFTQMPENRTTGSMYDTILIATDGSQYSMFAADKAMNIAKKNDSEVTAIFVFDAERYSGLSGNMYSADELRDLGETASKEALDAAMIMANDKGVKVITKTVFGHPAEAIIEESRHFDLVVCGSLGRTNISRALMGSVAEKVARMAYCPVLICRDHSKE